MLNTNSLHSLYLHYLGRPFSMLSLGHLLHIEVSRNKIPSAVLRIKLSPDKQIAPHSF